MVRVVSGLNTCCAVDDRATPKIIASTSGHRVRFILTPSPIFASPAARPRGSFLTAGPRWLEGYGSVHRTIRLSRVIRPSLYLLRVLQRPARRGQIPVCL